MKFFYTFLTLLLAVNTTIFAQLNTDLLAQMDYAQNLSDVWGYTAPDGTEYALVGVRNGVSIVSLDDPENPEEVAFIGGDNSVWRDIKTWDDHAYVVADQGDDGLTVIDLSDLPNSVSSSQWTPNIPGLGLLRRCHNLYIEENGKAFLTGCNVNSGGPFVVDVFTDPANPTYVDVATTTYAHDVFVQNDILYSSEIYAGNVTMYDVSDLNDVTQLGTQMTPLDFTHNAWANGDGTVVFTTDERANAPTAAFDISDYNNIELLDEFRPYNSLGSGVIPHNTHWKDDYLITSHYTDGVIIVDALDPSNLIEVGNYDSWSGNDGGFNGCWGAYPFFDNDKVLITDITNGLFVLDVTYTRAARIEGKVTDFITGAELNNVDVEILSNQLNATKTNASGDYKTGQEQEGLFTVQFSKNGYLTREVEVVLIKGEAVIQDVDLVPLSAVYSVSGNVTESPSGAPIEDAQLVLQNEDFYFVTNSNAGGEFTFPQVVQGTYDLTGGHWGHLQNQETGVAIFSNTSNLSISLGKGYQDDFIAELGWIVEANADDGNWVHGEPRGTLSSGNQANPENDTDGDYGDRSYITGNGGINANDDDVDGGPTRLNSPTMNLGIYNEPIIHLDAWFFNGLSGSSNDFYDIRINNGSNQVLLESISTSTQGWSDRMYNINDYISTTDQMTLKLEVSDNGADHSIEAGLDGFWVEEATPFVEFTGTPTEGCAPLGVQFTDHNNNAISWQWEFIGGTPANSNDQNPFVLYQDPGYHHVSLQIETWDGETYSITIDSFVYVPELPAADFSYSIDERVVQFTNESSDYDNSTWDFGDGQSSNLTNPIHEYAEDGIYNVTLTVANDCGESIISKDVEIATLPIANFNSNTQSGCVPLEVTYENLSSANSDSYIWTFEGGVPENSTEDNPIVSYHEQGLFAVTLIATNEVGSDTMEMENFVGVSDVPNAGFSFQVNDLTVIFTNQSSDAFSYEWQFGDGNISNEENPIHNYESDGIYTVTLISTNACGSDTVLLNVEISTLPTAGFDSDVQSGCVEFSVQFENQSSSNSTSWEWTFEGGTPGQSNLENPVVTYSATGTFNVTLVASNEEGSDTLEMSQFIGANDVPNAEFVSQTNLNTVIFTNLSTNAFSYEWQFGDGASSSLENPSHSYDSDGIYEVLLIAFNGCGPDTMSKTINISTPPHAEFEIDRMAGCVPFNVQFTDQSSENTDSWLWSFPGGNPASSTDQNPLITYEENGLFDVELIVSNEAGTDTLFEQVLIHAFDIPFAGFDYTLDDFTVSAQNTSHSYEEIRWEMGDGTVYFDESINHTYQDEGIYTLLLIAINGCGNDTTSVELNASLLPTAGFSPDKAFICAPSDVHFSDESSANAIEWNWYFEGGNPEFSNDQNPIINYSEKGMFDVQLIVTSLAGSDTLIRQNAVEVNTLPVASFDAQIDGSVISLENTSSNYDELQWSFGDGATSTESVISYNYESDGEYLVSLYVSNNCGIDTSTMLIKIVTPPSASFSSSEDLKCAPFQVEFYNESSENAEEFYWEFDGGDPASSTEENPIVTYHNKGQFGVMFIASNEAGSDTLQFIHYVEALGIPVSAFEFEPNLLSVDFDNQSFDGIEYHWDFGDGQFSIEASPIHVYNEPGTYDVQLIAINTCGSDTSMQKVTVNSTSVFDPEKVIKVFVAPNPTSHSTKLIYDLDSPSNRAFIVDIIDVHGKRIWEKQLNNQKGELTIDELKTQGLYLIRILQDGKIVWMDKLISLSP